MAKSYLKQDFDDVRCFFCNCYLATLWPILGYSQGDSLTNLILITAFQIFRPRTHREPCNKVGSLSPAKHLAGFELGTFQFLSHRLNPLGHSPHSMLSFCNKRQHITIHSRTPWGGYWEVLHVTLLTAPPSIHLYGNENPSSINQGNKIKIGEGGEGGVVDKIYQNRGEVPNV